MSKQLNTALVVPHCHLGAIAPLSCSTVNAHKQSCLYVRPSFAYCQALWTMNYVCISVTSLMQQYSNAKCYKGQVYYEQKGSKQCRAAAF